MIKGLDTNVLVRYLTQDDEGQAEVATKTIEGAAAKGEKMLIQPIILCELVWGPGKCVWLPQNRSTAGA